MNRTSRTAAFLLCLAIPATPSRGGAQDPVPPPKAAAQPDPIEALVTNLRAAERRAKSVRIELATRGIQPSGLEFQTSGTLHVLRGTHSKVRTAVTFSFANGIEGSMDSAHTAEGITIFESDPSFGEVLVHVPPAVVGDLEWAGEVLRRSDLPGMRDGRADSPFGSAMLDELRASFDLKVVADRKDRRGEAGTWLAGERRPGVGDLDADLQVPTRVEVFLRGTDQAVLEVAHYQGDKVVQHIDVKVLEVDVPIADPVFTVDPRGLPVRDVQKHAPMWILIEQALNQAESKAGEKRPSRRK